MSLAKMLQFLLQRNIWRSRTLPSWPMLFSSPRAVSTEPLWCSSCGDFRLVQHDRAMSILHRLIVVSLYKRPPSRSIVLAVGKPYVYFKLKRSWPDGTINSLSDKENVTLVASPSCWSVVLFGCDRAVTEFFTTTHNNSKMFSDSARSNCSKTWLNVCVVTLK